MSGKTGLDLTREVVKRVREWTTSAALPDEREAFEKWLGIKPCGAAHDFGWAAWKARAALAATPVQEVAPPEPVPSGMCLVNAGALQMVINALRRDAAEGKTVRGEMADALLATGGQGKAEHMTDDEAADLILEVMTHHCDKDAWHCAIEVHRVLLSRYQESAAPQQADARDAERLRFLVEDHASKEAREARNAICERLPVMSYSAACADIDAAISAAKEGKQRG